METIRNRVVIFAQFSIYFSILSCIKVRVIIQVNHIFCSLVSLAGGKSSLWKEVVSQEMDENWSQNYALPEDVCMYGFEPMMKVYHGMDIQWVRPPREGRCIEVQITAFGLTATGLPVCSCSPQVAHLLMEWIMYCTYIWVYNISDSFHQTIL